MNNNSKNKYVVYELYKGSHKSVKRFYSTKTQVPEQRKEHDHASIGVR